MSTLGIAISPLNHIIITIETKTLIHIVIKKDEVNL